MAHYEFKPRIELLQRVKHPFGLPVQELADVIINRCLQKQTVDLYLQFLVHGAMHLVCVQNRSTTPERQRLFWKRMLGKKDDALAGRLMRDKNFKAQRDPFRILSVQQYLWECHGGYLGHDCDAELHTMLGLLAQYGKLLTLLLQTRSTELVDRILDALRVGLGLTMKKNETLSKSQTGVRGAKRRRRRHHQALDELEWKNDITQCLLHVEATKTNVLLLANMMVSTATSAMASSSSSLLLQQPISEAKSEPEVKPDEAGPTTRPTTSLPTVWEEDKDEDDDDDEQEVEAKVQEAKVQEQNQEQQAVKVASSQRRIPIRDASDEWQKPLLMHWDADADADANANVFQDTEEEEEQHDCRNVTITRETLEQSDLLSSDATVRQAVEGIEQLLQKTGGSYVMVRLGTDGQKCFLAKPKPSDEFPMQQFMFAPTNLRQYLPALDRKSLLQITRTFGVACMERLPSHVMCAACYKPQSVCSEVFKVCAQCRVLSYCDSACQRQHWRLHKHDCLIMKERCQRPIESFLEF